MKDSITIVCCGLLLAAGILVSKTNITPTNTVSAAPLTLPSHVTNMVHDTISSGDTIRDTVPIIKYKTKYRIKRVHCTHNDTTVSNVIAKPREHRKETAPDTIPAKPRWYKLHGTIEPIEISETR